MPNHKTIIQAQNLAASYGSRAIWANADFEIKTGEFVALLGPNGAGKTTLFKLLLGLMTPSDGHLKIFGKKPTWGNPRISYVPQRRPVDNEVRIEAVEFVRLGLNGMLWGIGLPKQANTERRQALDVLASVDAAELAKQPLGQLSGGELQRVFLAQALISQPALLLLDEPLANLDIRRETELVQLIAKIVAQEQVAVLIIAHDINPLLPVLDRIIYIVNGQVATSRPDEVVTTKTLSSLYGAPVEVLHDSRGRVAVLGTEEAVHHE